MLSTQRGHGGMAVSPHHLASQAGLDVLREGGNAIEAMIAMAAAIPVVYPHMNAVGGDGFWLIDAGDGKPVAIDACGAAALALSPAWYRKQGHETIPSRGPLAANTVAGTVSGWGAAHELAKTMGGTLPLSRLLEAGVHYARAGFPATDSQARFTIEKRAECEAQPGFKQAFMPGGNPPKPGERFRQAALGETIARIGREGTESFYRGALAKDIAEDLKRIGAPVTGEDLARHKAKLVTPLNVDVPGARLFNMTPPTQGLASLLILAIFARIKPERCDGPAYVHALVEATKLAFRVRDKHVKDPAYMTVDPQSLLSDAKVKALAAEFDPNRAMPWPQPAKKGDTIWMGAIDAQGRMASFIQSIYWEFGSACVLPQTGLLWQNRGTSFSLEKGAAQELMAGRKPFHTLNPALARFDDGRSMVYGTMGGDGQPQTQAMIFSRHAFYGMQPQEAVTAPRWLLGRTWGTATTKLRLESRFPAGTIAALRGLGHDLEVVSEFTDLMGHAGMIVRTPASDGPALLEGATDPRSDGQVGTF
ncbi:MAG: gamma-glutamyltransferase family protein [Tagaea sp.]|nr:gamma-glutamyltransferase family protein [Tagaea sp.]